MEVVDDMHAGQSQGGWSHVGKFRSASRVRGDILMSLWVEPELVGLPGKALAMDVTRRLRFVVHAAGWLHSMVLYRRNG